MTIWREWWIRVVFSPSVVYSYCPKAALTRLEKAHERLQTQHEAVSFELETSRNHISSLTVRLEQQQAKLVDVNHAGESIDVTRVRPRSGGFVCVWVEAGVIPAEFPGLCVLISQRRVCVRVAVPSVTILHRYISCSLCMLTRNLCRKQST